MVRSWLLFPALALLLTAIPALSQNSLYIQHPQQTWRIGIGSIDTAVITMKPKGVFAECSMYLTISGRGLSFTAYDSVEIQYKFELPKDAQVHDLWLWVDNSIMQAQIMDVWKASAIYENIVKRRRDPAILFKRGERSYELRIYPMKGTSRRKIRLTYSVPMQWSRGAAAISLPMAMLRLSNYAVPYVGLVTYPNAEWGVPKIVELPAATFQMQYDSVFAAYAKAAVMSPLPSSVTVSWPTPMRNGVYLKRYGTADAGTYQFALLPGDVLGQRRPRKLAVLIDYEAARTTLAGATILATLKSQLKQELAERDSFTVMASDLIIQQVSPIWLGGDSATIETAFQSLPALKGYTNLLALLSAGIDFVKRNGNDGAIVLISSSDQWGNYQTANQVLVDLKAAMSPLLPFHILDLANNSPAYYYFNNRYYYGNEYLYDNLARSTAGFFATLRNSPESVGTLAARLFQSVGSLIAACDLFTSTQGGFCYGRYTMSGYDGSAYLNTPIVQTGKYYGQFPFIIQLAGVIYGSTFNNVIVIPPDTTIDGDISVERSWEGVKIASWEKATQTSQMINSILESSIASRVLSQYTAFLALEPNDTLKACLTCLDETRIGVDVEADAREENPDSAFAAYPNPFNAGTVIRGKIPLAVGSGEVRLQVFNILGQLVRDLDISKASPGERFEVRWDARSDRGTQVPSGTYFCVLTGPNVRATLKLLVLK